MKILFDSSSFAKMYLRENGSDDADALHVACALEWGAELFVSSDKRQVRAATRSGLATREV